MILRKCKYLYFTILYEGQTNENRTPAKKWQWNLFYSKVIGRSVNTFIPLGDESINSSLVERGRSLIDPQPHPLLHFLVKMKPTSTNVFLQVAKNAQVTRGKIWVVRRMLKCFPAKSLKLIPHQIGSIGTGVIMQMDDSFRQHSRAFWLYCASQHTQQPRNEPHHSPFLYLPPFSMPEKQTVHYAHLQSNKVTSAWTYLFSLCIFPTLQMGLSTRNNSITNFCEEYVL